MQKIYLDETSHATLICQLCGKTRLFEAVRHPRITKELTFRGIADKVVSGEFDDIDNYDNNDKKIGFYLMNLLTKTEA